MKKNFFALFSYFVIVSSFAIKPITGSCKVMDKKTYAKHEGESYSSERLYAGKVIFQTRKHLMWAANLFYFDGHYLITKADNSQENIQLQKNKHHYNLMT